MKRFVKTWLTGVALGTTLISGAFAGVSLRPVGGTDAVAAGGAAGGLRSTSITAATHPQVSAPLTVMSYNILHGQPCAGGSLGSEVEPRMALAIAGNGSSPGLAALAPDIIGMQEVSQVLVDQTVEENQACMVFATVPFLNLDPSITEISAYEHQGDTLARLLNGSVSGSPYKMRFVRDNPRLLPLVDDAALPHDSKTLSDVNAELGNVELGLAVLAKYRIQQVTVHNLTIGEVPGETRAIMHATIRIPNGHGGETPIDFFDSHLTTTGGNSPQTVAMAAEIVRFITASRRYPENPGIFLCDCNAEESSATHAAFQSAGFQDTFRAANPSTPGLTSGRDGLSASCTQTVGKRIDYVWQIPNQAGALWPVTDSTVEMNYSANVAGGTCRWPSDHNAVLTTFETGNLVASAP